MTKLIILFFPMIIFAKSFFISNIPLPKTYIQNLDPYTCDNICLQEYLDNDMIFSFLAHANKKLEDETQDEIRVMNVAIFNLGSQFIIANNVKIAMLLPYKKIGKYASSTTNAVFSYLITKTHPFELRSYKIRSENEDDIAEALQKIQTDGFAYVIAPLTQKGVQSVINLHTDLNIYFPTVNKNDIQTESENLIFGAIDYQAQANLLIQEAVSPLVIFSDKSSTGKKLSDFEAEAFNNIDEHTTIKYYISRKTTNLENYLEENEKIIEGSFFLNTPIVKSGMIMSQLTLYDTNATNILSTQVNYDPLILSMTQYDDRKNMIVANSIIQSNNVITEINALLSNDIVYDWINYATTIGVDYFFNILTNEEREYNIVLQNQQVMYDIELLKPSVSRFIKYQRVQE